MAGQRIFVTGATGVLGRRVVPRLLTAGHQVSALARSDDKADALRRVGASPAMVDLFDPGAVEAAVSGHDAVVHLATKIPTGAGAATKRGWQMNDRLRTEAAGNLSQAAIETGVGRYVGESISFPYLPNGADWIDEDHPRSYFWGNRTTVDAEAAAQRVTDAGGVGISLRFAMFFAVDSAHLATYMSIARHGLFGLFGELDDHISFIGIDDAAAAVCAALAAPPGTYNIAEPSPVTRQEHRVAMSAAAGRERLRPMPKTLVRAAGKGAESLARAHRISSSRFSDATGWMPVARVVEHWKDIE
jgi:nucleoside-diphosphate-sugar epimerase